MAGRGSRRVAGAGQWQASLLRRAWPRTWRTLGGAALAASTLAAGMARADCLTLISGPVVVDVQACKLVDPEQSFDTSKERFAFISGFDPGSRKKFLDTYRGLYLKTKVVKSQAEAKGLNPQNNMLTGDTVFMYIAPPVSMQCDAINGKRANGNLRQVCCDGNGDIPCLLSQDGYLLSGVQVIGAAASAAGDVVRQKAKRSSVYKAGDKALAEKKYKAAAKSYESARSNGELDVAGHYKLGIAYREMDQCRDAIPPLKYIYDQHMKKQVWADEEDTARKAIFLLARCYAKINDPSPSVLILNAYLLEPGKYRKELQDSLNHKDFGWIHTSKEYRDYEKAARQKLNAKSNK